MTKDTDKKGEDIIDFYAEYLHRYSNYPSSSLWFEGVEAFITDLLTRQDRKSYERGCEDMKRLFSHYDNPPSIFDQEIKSINPKDQ